MSLAQKLTAVSLAFLQQGNTPKYFPYTVSEQVVSFVRCLARLSIFS